MHQTELTVREAPDLWPGTRVYRLACEHGTSAAALVPGAKPLADTVVFDLVLSGHHRRYRCTCAPELALPVPVAARA